MVNEKKLQETIDRSEIENLIAKSILTRDSGQWDELAACYHPDAKLTSSWFTGKPTDLIETARKTLKAAREAGGEQKHMTGSLWIELNGDRAVAECDLILYQRRAVKGVELDFATWSRRLHQMAKHNGEWKIFRRTAIYERDRMDPADPNGVPAGFYEAMDLSKYPRQLRYHLWRNEMLGSAPVRISACGAASGRRKCARKRGSGSPASSARLEGRPAGGRPFTGSPVRTKSKRPGPEPCRGASPPKP
jgi:hypothetical protein